MRSFVSRIYKLQSFRVLESSDRNSSVDVFRAFAIIIVVLYHFNQNLAYGYLGVDLFFVISGLLVGGLLVKKMNEGETISFFKFFLQRGFKIWPSYYTFLVLGSILAFILYRKLSPEEIIPLWDAKRYILFYQNYTGAPFHWSFDHVWSLCVEEHFYILLPVLFILIQQFFNNRIFLFLSVLLVIIAGITFKVLSVLYTNSKDTYAGTHVRIDALGWGVLLTLILNFYPQWLRNKRAYLLFWVGLLVGISSLIVHINTDSYYYRKIAFHSILPFCFFLMIAGLYYYDFSRLKFLRFIAYYSYNWYLWHPLLVIYLTHLIGNNIGGLIIYLILSFLLAIFFTIVVEEPFLKWRKPVLNKFFRQKEVKSRVRA